MPRWLIFPPLAILALVGILYLRSEAVDRGPRLIPPCLTHEITGWHCPGCGMTRGAKALARGHFLTALSMNPLGMILLPLVALWLLVELIGWTRGYPFGQAVLLPSWLPWATLFLVLSYGVLRNLPWFPFTLLAPGGISSLSSS